MKAKLEFSLPEEQDEFTFAIKGKNYWNCLYELDQKLRGILKYGHQYKNVDELAEELRMDIRNNVDLDEIS